MGLRDVPNTLHGFETGDLLGIVKEKRALKVSVVTGAAADTPTPVTGIAMEDTVLSVLSIDGDNATLSQTVRVDNAFVIVSAGNIQSAASHAASRLVVLWFDKSGA